MTAYERSGWRDQEISQRHRNWGFHCPSVDLDFLLLEYYFGQPIALVDYKHHQHHEGRNVNYRHPSYMAMGRMYDEQGKQIPLFICRYWPESWAVESLAVNDAAQALSKRPGEWVPMSECDWVTGLYRIRNRVIEAGVIANLNRELPPDEDRELQFSSANRHETLTDLEF
jgi:hypothetical protein